MCVAKRAFYNFSVCFEYFPNSSTFFSEKNLIVFIATSCFNLWTVEILLKHTYNIQSVYSLFSMSHGLDSQWDGNSPHKNKISCHLRVGLWSSLQLWSHALADTDCRRLIPQEHWFFLRVYSRSLWLSPSLPSAGGYLQGSRYSHRLYRLLSWR